MRTRRSEGYFRAKLLTSSVELRRREREREAIAGNTEGTHVHVRASAGECRLAVVKQ